MAVVFSLKMHYHENSNDSMKKKSLKKSYQTKIYLSLILILTTSLFISTSLEQAFADTISNDNYQIDVNSINTIPQPSPRPQVLGTNNIKIKDFTTGPNYTVDAPNNSLSISLSQNSIDYGILSSTNPVIRTSKIFLIDNNLGDEVLTYEDTPLTSSTKDVIENTSCDNGVCNPGLASIWDNTLTYGFGYRCDSTGANVCVADLSYPDYFKPYADLSINATPQSVILTKKGKSEADLTYKVNISGTQKSGSYYNSITYLAIPKF